MFNHLNYFLELSIFCLPILLFGRQVKRAAFVCSLFVALSTITNLFFTMAWQYYLVCAVYDLLFIAALFLFCYPSRMVIALQSIAILSIAWNACGFVLWYLYQPPLIYNVGYSIINILVIVVLSKSSGEHVGSNTTDKHHTGVYTDRDKSGDHNHLDMGAR